MLRLGKPPGDPMPEPRESTSGRFVVHYDKRFKASLVAGITPAACNRELSEVTRTTTAASLPKVSFEFWRGVTLETFDSRSGDSGLNDRRGTRGPTDLVKANADKDRSIVKVRPIAPCLTVVWHQMTVFLSLQRSCAVGRVESHTPPKKI